MQETQDKSQEARKTVTHWIDGKPFEEPDVDRYGDIFDPATGEVQGRVALASQAVVDAAVSSGEEAFDVWGSTPAPKRVRVFYNFRDLLLRHADELAALITSEHGKTLDDAAGEGVRGRETVEVALSAPTLLKGDFSNQVANGFDTYSLRQPLGVCVGITPFNFPVMIPLYMSAVAIAAGNSFVLKPSEQDPSPSMFLAELWDEAGLPPGVFNVVHGDKVAVDALLDHPRVQATSFIGSTPVARHVYQRGAASGKRVQAFGGAKNHMVVLPDADMDQAADALTSAAYGSAGQRCMAITTAVAVGQAGDELVEKTRERIGALRVGIGSDPESDLGPLIRDRARERVLSYIERGAEAGAELVVDGRAVRVEGHENGFFVGPCLFDHVTPDMELYQDEIFGPVLIVVRVDTFDEALALVKSNRYGNGSAIFTRSGWAARRFQEEATTGTVGINVPIPFPVSFYGFGGWNDSRFGDHNINADAFHFYTKPKVVTARWQRPPAGVDMGFMRSE